MRLCDPDFKRCDFQLYSELNMLKSKLNQMITSFKSFILFSDRSDMYSPDANSDAIYVFTNVIDYHDGLAM